MIHRLLLATESSPNRLLTKVKPAPLCTGFLPNLFKFRMSKRLQKRGAFAQCKPVHHIPFKIPSLGRPHARWRPPGWRWSRGVRSGRARAGRRILAVCFSRRDSRSTKRPWIWGWVAVAEVLTVCQPLDVIKKNIVHKCHSRSPYKPKNHAGRLHMYTKNTIKRQEYRCSPISYISYKIHLH